MLGGLLAVPIAVMVMGKEAGAFFYVVPFLISSIGGSVMAFLILKFTDFLKFSKNTMLK